jgi:hypothetical protein
MGEQLKEAFSDLIEPSQVQQKSHDKAKKNKVAG